MAENDVSVDKRYDLWWWWADMCLKYYATFKAIIIPYLNIRANCKSSH
jgi:hypothetical protein